MVIKWSTQFVLILTIVVLIAGLSACDQIQQLLLPETPQMEELRGEIAIGAVHPITGRLGLDNPPLGQGFALAVAEINSSQLSDVKIKLIVEDGQSTVEGAVEAFNKLIHQDSVSAILGPAHLNAGTSSVSDCTTEWSCSDKSHLCRPWSQRDW